MSTIKDIKYIPLEKLIDDSQEELKEYEEEEIDMYEILLKNLKSKKIDKVLNSIFFIEYKKASNPEGKNFQKYKDKFRRRISKIYKTKKEEIDRYVKISDEFKN